MSKTILLTGGNIGDTIKYLEATNSLLEMEVGKIVNRSKYYKSEPWGFETDQEFINQALIIETKLSPNELLKGINEIERKLGRIRDNSGEYSARTVDIDIIFYDDLILYEPDLTIPHRLMHERRFVLEPIHDIAPLWLHPVFKKNILELLDECGDNSVVKAIQK